MTLELEARALSAEASHTPSLLSGSAQVWREVLCPNSGDQLTFSYEADYCQCDQGKTGLIG